MWKWWRKQYIVRCPDGTEKIIHKNINDILPLALKDLSASTSASMKAYQQAEGQLNANYREDIKNILFAIDDYNKSLVINYRQVYIAYMSDPCANSPFLKRETEKILEEQRARAALNTKADFLIRMLSFPSPQQDIIAQVFNEIASILGGPAVAPAAALEIAETRSVAEGLMHGK